MVSTPLFSIVIPLYNRPIAIIKAIDSIIAQSVQDFEILIVDDGSSDNSKAAVLAHQDPRIKYFHQQNSGANTARNKGIEEARGRYIAFLDSDDTFLEGHLERSLAALEAHPNTAVFARIIVDRGNGRTFLKPPRGPRADERIDEYLTCDRGFVQTSTLTLPAEVAKNIKYKEGLKAGQDMDFAIRLFDKGVGFHMIETPGALWSDESDPSRISAGTNPEVRVNWLEEMEATLSRKAYLGFRGWFMAKTFSQRGHKLAAYKYFFAAVSNRCYNPKLAATIFLQITLVGGAYRALANILVTLKGLRATKQTS